MRPLSLLDDNSMSTRWLRLPFTRCFSSLMSCLFSPSIHSVLVLRGGSRPHLDAHRRAGPTPDQRGFAGVLRHVEEEVQVRHLPRREQAPRSAAVFLTPPGVLVAPRVGRPEPAVMSAQPELVLAEHLGGVALVGDQDLDVEAVIALG